MFSCPSNVLLPFTYSSFKPYKGPFGIMTATSFNSQHLPNPCDGIVFSSEDLSEFGTYLSVSNNLGDVINAWSERLERIESHWKQVVTDMSQSVVNFDDLLSPLDAIDSKSSEKTIDDSIKVLIENQEVILKHCPIYYANNAIIDLSLNDLIKAITLEEKVAALIEIRNKYKRGKQVIHHLFILAEGELNHEEMIERDEVQQLSPRMYQLWLVKQYHLNRAKECFENWVSAFSSVKVEQLNITIPDKKSNHYQSVVDSIGQSFSRHRLFNYSQKDMQGLTNFQQKTLALLQDYVKNGFLRFVLGMWRRHHIKAVQTIISQIKTLNDLALVNELQSFSSTHKSTGSLARRIKFLEQDMSSIIKNVDISNFHEPINQLKLRLSDATNKKYAESLGDIIGTENPKSEDDLSFQ